MNVFLDDKFGHMAGLHARASASPSDNGRWKRLMEVRFIGRIGIDFIWNLDLPFGEHDTEKWSKKVERAVQGLLGVDQIVR